MTLQKQYLANLNPLCHAMLVTNYSPPPTLDCRALHRNPPEPHAMPNASKCEQKKKK